jgi:hypothetical protein
MNSLKVDNLSRRVEKEKVEEEFEKKFFPKSYQKKKTAQAMREPKFFEAALKEKLRRIYK